MPEFRPHTLSSIMNIIIKIKYIQKMRWIYNGIMLNLHKLITLKEICK